MTAYRFEVPLDTFDRPKGGSPDCYTLPDTKPHPDGISEVAPCFYGKLCLHGRSLTDVLREYLVMKCGAIRGTEGRQGAPLFQPAFYMSCLNSE